VDLAEADDLDPLLLADDLDGLDALAAEVEPEQRALAPQECHRRLPLRRRAHDEAADRNGILFVRGLATTEAGFLASGGRAGLRGNPRGAHSSWKRSATSFSSSVTSGSASSPSASKRRTDPAGAASVSICSMLRPSAFISPHETVSAA